MSRRLVVGGALVALVVVVVAVVLATGGGDGQRLVVYTARAHYGEEQPFREFASRERVDLTLFGGSAPELYERLRNEGDRTRADVFITVDGANLWRARSSGLLQPLRSSALDRAVPAGLRDPQGYWYALTVRARTIVRSTERVPAGTVTHYRDLGDPRWRGRLCLRSGTSEYNVSFVADRIAKFGRAATERLLRSWMANQPRILGSDVDVIQSIADGRCDLGLVNSYYLGRMLASDPNLPVALEWADQDGRGTHVNLSGIGITRYTRHRELARKLVEYLTRPSVQEELVRNNKEFPADPAVPGPPELRRFGTFKRDPIDVAGAARHLQEALALMEEVGWR
ncbi:extracellular solute-binding protein [Thermoleophilum album]|uniref:ABC transporter substrate-binding protein n=1 Tax=Thermoleophilum album TaxID=29539 RepID=UPI00237D253F|nr:ABC transporter substrate-binding protein [Thermoleophilum album]WDT93195.1 extracellular solute-binding protein [Thermoleophilum album]